MALENYPLIAGVLAVGFWVGFAYRTPIYSKLYKEMGYSILLGTGVSYSYAYYHYLKYLNVVDESYNIVKMRFASNPQIVERENPDNSPNQIKNFGLSAWNDNDTHDDYDLDENTQKIFQGTAEAETKSVRSELVEGLYGK